MENCSRFFENKACEYFPCHKGLDDFNCMFCYCPFYLWERCPGKNYYIEKNGRKIKVCTDCVFPHRPENYDTVIKLLIEGKEKFAENEEEQSKVEQGRTEPSKADKKKEDNHSQLGCFLGIGVGSGEPALITKEAEEAIEEADVLILPASSKEKCRAYRIVEQAFNWVKDKECLCIPFPMSMEEPDLSLFHKEVAASVEKLLDEKKCVGFLTIGDVSIYSTFNYIEDIVKSDGYATKYIAGIPSFCAAAARLGMPIALGDEEIHIIPGRADIDKSLLLDGTLIFMKSGKKLLELKDKLISLEGDKEIDVRAVSNCGMDDEIITIGAKNITEQNGYLTVVFVRNKCKN